MSTIQVSNQEYRQMISTFCKELPTLNMEELENSFKCVGLAYFGLSIESLTDREQYESVLLYRIAQKKYFEREFSLMCPSLVANHES